MTDPRHRTIRLYTLLAACLAASLFWPSLALYFFASFSWTPLGLFMPVFSSSSPCTNGCPNGYPTQFQIDVSGMADGTDCTNCSSLDGTYVAGYDPQGGNLDCSWAASESTTISCSAACSGPVTSQSVRLYITKSGSDYFILGFATADTASSAPTSEFVDNIGTSTPDCPAISEAVPFFDNLKGSTPDTCGCDGTSATYTITAL